MRRELNCWARVLTGVETVAAAAVPDQTSGVPASVLRSVLATHPSPTLTHHSAAAARIPSMQVIPPGSDQLSKLWDQGELFTIHWGQETVLISELRGIDAS